MRVFKLISILFFFPGISLAESLKPWSHLDQNLGQSFSGDRLYLHGAALAATAGLLFSKADAKVFDWIRDKPESRQYTRPLVRFAGWSPYIFAPPLMLHGALADNKETLYGGYAAAQATVIAVPTVLLLKALTGRDDADIESEESAYDQSLKWRFGFLRGGVYNGWPSGHVTTSTAIISSLIHFYSNSNLPKIIGYPLIAAITASVTLHGQGQMHWLSESIAGALIGYAIGWTVGDRLRDAYDEELGRGKTDVPTANLAAPIIELGFSF